jgi:hypothetical protein
MVYAIKAGPFLPAISELQLKGWKTGIKGRKNEKNKF